MEDWAYRIRFLWNS